MKKLQKIMRRNNHKTDVELQQQAIGRTGEICTDVICANPMVNILFPTNNYFSRTEDASQYTTFLSVILSDILNVQIFFENDTPSYLQC